MSFFSRLKKNVSHIASQVGREVQRGARNPLVQTAATLAGTALGVPPQVTQGVLGVVGAHNAGEAFSSFARMGAMGVMGGGMQNIFQQGGIGQQLGALGQGLGITGLQGFSPQAGAPPAIGMMGMMPGSFGAGAPQQAGGFEGPAIGALASAFGQQGLAMPGVGLQPGLSTTMGRGGGFGSMVGGGAPPFAVARRGFAPPQPGVTATMGAPQLIGGSAFMTGFQSPPTPGMRAATGHYTAGFGGVPAQLSPAFVYRQLHGMPVQVRGGS